jgi:hypothetical protein
MKCAFRKRHDTRWTHGRCTHRHWLYPGLPPSSPGTTSHCPTLIIVHKALDSRSHRVRTSHILRSLPKTKRTGWERYQSVSTSPRERIASAQEREGNPSLIRPKPQVDVASSSTHTAGRLGTARFADKVTCRLTPLGVTVASSQTSVHARPHRFRASRSDPSGFIRAEAFWNSFGCGR